MTYRAPAGILPAMEEPIRRRLTTDLLHPRPDAVTHALFRSFPDFFDSRDLLQVRYELLRGHCIDGETVVRVCREFGISRQTFYNLLEKFERQGIPGLLPGMPGPKGPTKVTPAVREFVGARLVEDPEVSGMVLAARLKDEFSLALHKRTVERLLRDLRSKKNT